MGISWEISINEGFLKMVVIINIEDTSINIIYIYRHVKWKIDNGEMEVS